MTESDARPVGETQPFQPGGLVEAERLMALRVAVLDAAEEVENTPIQQRVQAWDRVEIALHAYTDAVAAEARAALLRDAPVVFVATDARSVNVSAIYNNEPQMRYGAATNDDEDDGLWLWGRPPLTPPGTVRRYALVPHPEGEETPT